MNNFLINQAKAAKLLLAVLASLTIASSLFYSLKTGLIFTIPLACIAAVPVYILVLNTGFYIGFAALLIIIPTLFLLVGKICTLTYVGFFLLPALFGSILLSLSRTNLKHRLSLSRIFFDLTVINIIIISSLLLLLEYLPSFKNNLKEIIIAKINSIFALTVSYGSNSALSNKIINIKQLFLQHFDLLLGNMLAVYCLCFTLSNLYFGILLSRKINVKSVRHFSWSKELFLPLISMIILPICLIFSLWNTYPAIELVMNIGLVSFTLAFFVSGLAYLHNITLPLIGRSLLLALIYISLLTSPLFTAPLFITITLMGFWSTLKSYQQYKYFI